MKNGDLVEFDKARKECSFYESGLCDYPDIESACAVQQCPVIRLVTISEIERHNAELYEQLKKNMEKMKSQKVHEQRDELNTFPANYSEFFKSWVLWCGNESIATESWTIELMPDGRVTINSDEALMIQVKEDNALVVFAVSRGGEVKYE